MATETQPLPTGVTFFGIFLTPVFYYVIQWLNDTITGDHGTPVAPTRHDDHHDHHVVEVVEEPSGEHVLTGNGAVEKAEPTFTHH